jgi:salicylate hydroxylase
MSGNGRIIYIAGAGIAGLTLALALGKFGARVVVLERQPSVQEFGAGLQISPNARKVLDRLGLDEALNERAFTPHGIDVYPLGAKRPLVTLELGQRIADRFGAPYAVMHRADLADMLHRAAKRFANIDVLFNVRSHDVVSHEAGVSVVVDEADGKTRTARAFAFIGADGVRSRTRREVMMGPEAVSAGRVAWRALLPIDALDGVIARDRTSLLWAPGMHAVIYPLPARGQLNVVMFSSFDEAYSLSESALQQPELPRRVARDPRFAAILAAVRRGWTFWPLAKVETPSWHQGGIGLIGDAAHAMLPFQAQGAAMGIEDAAVLAPLLMRSDTAAAALARFEMLRRPRVERVQQLSERNGHAFHADWPVSTARDLVVRAQGPHGHLTRLAWIYGYDAAET